MRNEIIRQQRNFTGKACFLRSKRLTPFGLDIVYFPFGGNFMKNSVQFIAGALAASGLLFGALPGASARAEAASCVDQIHYWTDLLAPDLESWAKPVDAGLLTKGTPESECQYTKQLMELFTSVQSIRASNAQDKKPLRGTHAKGVCINGTFQTQFGASLSEQQKAILEGAELFRSDGSLATQFRFANGDGHIAPDWVADVRALSLKVQLPNGRRQDFAFNNVDRFELNNLSNFVRVMQFAKGIELKQLTPPDANAGLAEKLKFAKDIVEYFTKLHQSEGQNLLAAGLHAAIDTGELLKVEGYGDADKKYHSSYTNQVYWSTPFILGEAGNSAARIVKFGAAPCSKLDDTTGRPMISSQLGRTEISKSEAIALAQDLQDKKQISNKDNYLKETLVNQVKTAPVCYELFVQFLNETSDPSKSDLVEDASTEWHGPVHSVGSLTVSQDVLADGTCDEPTNFVSVVKRDDPTLQTFKHAEGIHPVGQINRARDFVETVSWQNR